ncbi:predicted protein [Naegleria gruberi]|uniref:Predicted protein n=1 Tax=Naegleria gruberi TaxID=5762 RepID=D2W1W2_NAEGR|nr:uncharacterized protein NAEGRDRAFT_75290 [Naegleria gruberi]EFC36933.1 predicted protein [Naegleria gruberi]|eukprot:XP_002669677.1 predicted protein [Naegleria gruberi strain NEG-M]
MKRTTINFAKKAGKILHNSKTRFEEFIAVVRMNELSSQDPHTKPFMLYSNLLGKNEAKILKTLDLDSIELVEVIRKCEKKAEETISQIKPETSTDNIQVSNSEHTNETPNNGDESPTSSDSGSIEIDMKKIEHVKHTIIKDTDETKRIKPVPEDFLIEKDDILIFKGNAKSILKLQAMVLEIEDYEEESSPKQNTDRVTTFNSTTEEETVMKNSPSQLSLMSSSSQDELIPNGSNRIDSPVVGGQNDIVARLHSNLKKNHPTNENSQNPTKEQDQKEDKSADLSQLEFFEVVIGSSNPCVGENYEFFEKRYQVTVLAIRNMFYDEKPSESSDQGLRNFQVYTGDTILLLGKTRFYMNYHNSTREFYMISRFSEVSPQDNQFNQRPFQLRIPFTNKVYRLWWWEHWIFLFFSAMIACTIAGYSMVQCSLVTFCVVIMFGLISPTDAIESIDWALVALVGASFGIGSAITQSGVGQGITQVLKLANVPHILLPAFITAITLVVANVITSSAVVAICIPIAVAIAQSYGLNARCFVMCVIYASQSVFTFPLGFSGNMLVMGVGNYKFVDFVKAGVPLTILYWLIISVLVPAIWGLDIPNF